MKIPKKSILVILIIILAFVPRSIELFNRNYLWGFDQGEHYLAAWDIVVNKNPTLIGTKVGGAGGFFQGPGWYYLLAIPLYLAHGDPYAGIVLMLVVAIAAVFFAYYFGQKMFGETTGLLFAFFLAISPGIIPQARFIWPPFPITLISIFYFFFLFKVLKGKKVFLPLVTFFIGLMSHFEIATSGSLLLQLIIFSPVLFWKRLISIKYLLLSIISFTFTFLPLIIFDFKNQHLIIKGIINMFSSEQVRKNSIGWVILNHTEVFLNSFKSTFYAGEKFWFLFIIFFIVGLFVFLKNKKTNQELKILIIYFFVSPFLLFIVFLLYPQGMWEWWILQMPVTYCLLFAVFLDTFTTYKFGKPLFLIVLLFFYLHI